MNDRRNDDDRGNAGHHLSVRGFRNRFNVVRIKFHVTI